MTITINDSTKFGPILDGLQQQVIGMDYANALKDSQQDIAKSEAAMFAGEFDSNLSPWAPLNPATSKKKGQDRILFATGALQESLVNIGGAGNIAESMPREMLFGTEVDYAIFHQDGTSRMPARPPVGLSEETLDKLCRRIADETVNQLAASGSR